ncbi:MAG: hypothetical protein QXS74_07565 [Nitrososphaeria archaeon]
MIFVIMTLGSLFGILYSILGAVDSFTLYSAKAAEEIVLDGKINWNKEIYLWAGTQNHAGLELFLSTLLIVTHINPSELIYLPIGSFLYSLVITLLLVDFFIHKTEILGSFFLFLFSIIAVSVAFSAGNYVSNFYSIFHISFGYPLVISYVYVTCQLSSRRHLRWSETYLILILLFGASALFYYSVNSELLFFVLIMYLYNKCVKFFDIKHDHPSLWPSGNHLITLLVLWCVLNSVSLYDVVIRILKSPVDIIPILMSIFFKPENYAISQPSIHHPYSLYIPIIDRLLRISVLLPIFLYIPITAIHICIRELREDEIIMHKKILMFMIFLFGSTILDIVGYGYYGASGVYNRHIYFLGPSISVSIFSSLLIRNWEKICLRKVVKVLMITWLIISMSLSLIKIPYTIMTVKDYKIKTYCSTLNLLDANSIIYGGYRTFGIIFLQFNVSSKMLKDLGTTYNDTLHKYDLSKIIKDSLILIIERNWNYYVDSKGGFALLPPLSRENLSLANSFNFVYDSSVLMLWYKV